MKTAGQTYNILFRKLLCSFCLFFFLVIPLNLSAREKSSISLSLYDNPIQQTIKLIENSTRQVQAVIYKFEEKSLLAAIKKAHDRGVEIQLLVDINEAKEKKSRVKEAIEYGIKVRKWRNGKLHAKFAVIDKSTVITGSFNWTKAAKKKNMELILLYADQATVNRFLYLYNDLWNRAAPETGLDRNRPKQQNDNQESVHF